MKNLDYPVCLSVAGFDNCAAAGILADIKTFHSLKCYGTAAISSLTSQTIRSVKSIYPVPEKEFSHQLNSIFETFTIDSIKIGMIFKKNHMKILEKYLQTHKIPVVIDPILFSSSGKPLIENKAVAYLKKLFPYASIVTPNLPEILFLLDKKAKDKYHLEEIKELCFYFYETLKVPLLLKGGHIPFFQESYIYDFFWDGTQFQVFRKRRKIKNNVRGTGCTLSSAITAYLAKKENLSNAVKKGIQFINQKINSSFIYDKDHRIIFH